MTTDLKKNLPKELVAHLKVIEGPDRGLNTKILYDTTTVGRRQADIIFTDPKISSTHCKIEYRNNGKFYLVDLKSTNGTFLNNVAITESILSDGNIVKVGSTLCIFTSTSVHNQKMYPKTEEATQARTSVKVGIKQLVDEEFQKLKTQKASMEALKNASHEEHRPGDISIALEVIAGKDTGKKFSITKGSVFIGRTDTDIAIHDADVSRRHMLIEIFGKDQIFVRDLASTNGTYINDKKIVNAKVCSNDVISIGNTKLKLILTEK